MGNVIETGDAVTSLEEGDRVVMPFNVACGFCRNCENGYTGFCTNVNPGFAGGAYGYVAMDRTRAARPRNPGTLRRLQRAETTGG